MEGRSQGPPEPQVQVAGAKSNLEGALTESWLEVTNTKERVSSLCDDVAELKKTGDDAASRIGATSGTSKLRRCTGIRHDSNRGVALRVRP